MNEIHYVTVQDHLEIHRPKAPMDGSAAKGLYVKNVEVAIAALVDLLGEEGAIANVVSSLVHILQAPSGANKGGRHESRNWYNQ